MNQLLLQVGELIKQKKDNEIFDITCLPNWNPQKDEELNKLIQTHQICGILPYGFDGKICKYTAASRSNHAVYIPDSELVEKAESLLKRAEHYKDMIGYSQELQEYCEELSTVANQIIDEQSEFIDYNKTIIAILLGENGLQWARAFDSTIYKCSLGGDPLIRKLHDLHNVCAKHILNQ